MFSNSVARNDAISNRCIDVRDTLWTTESMSVISADDQIPAVSSGAYDVSYNRYRGHLSNVRRKGAVGPWRSIFIFIFINPNSG
jgi:hypothetical protein